MSQRIDYSERLLIEALLISGRFAVLDEVTTRLLPHSFSTLSEAERYVALLQRYRPGLDPEGAAAAVASEGIAPLPPGAVVWAADLDADEPEFGARDGEASEQRGWATIPPAHARIGGPVTDWMTTYPHRRAVSVADLAEHMDRLSKHGQSFALVAFRDARITEIARNEPGDEPRPVQPQAERR